MPIRAELKTRRFTESAERIIRQITERACARDFLVWNEGSLPLLALWTLIRWERKFAVGALERTGIELSSLAHDLDIMLDKRRDAHAAEALNCRLVYAAANEPVPLAWEAYFKPFLKAASAESAELHHHWVGTEHLLLAVIATADSELTAILNRYGISREGVQKAVVDLLENRS
jgi:ATP-dependent Clp protease ATP-binding subunit ClpA